MILPVLTSLHHLESEFGEATNFTSAEASQIFFDLFMNNSQSATDDSTDKLSTAAIVGIVVSVFVTLVIVIILVAIIYSNKRFKYKLK